ncbi:MAG: hypothetical protein KIS91_11325 [Anaerolineae bacterium]|nr:hypothetical protein [Anaerolineae bacterium]
MPHLIVMVVDQEDAVSDVIDAWQRCGVTGMTLLSSSGLGRVLRDAELPLMSSLRNLFASSLETHSTIFVVVPDDFDIQGLFDATEAVTGSLDSPDSGIIFASPVTHVRGLGRMANMRQKPR